MIISFVSLSVFFLPNLWFIFVLCFYRNHCASFASVILCVQKVPTLFIIYFFSVILFSSEIFYVVSLSELSNT